MSSLEQPKLLSKLQTSKKISMFESIVQEDIFHPGSSLKFVGHNQN